MTPAIANSSTVSIYINYTAALIGCPALYPANFLFFLFAANALLASLPAGWLP